MTTLIILNIITFSALIIQLLFFLNSRRLFNKTYKALTESRKHLEQLSVLRDSMLEITQAIVGTENPYDIYEMILTKTITAIPVANVGSVLLKKKDGLFHCCSHKGFDNDKIEEFSLPLEETILWKYTGGKISQTEIINDVENISGLNVRPLTVDSEEWTIRSTISVPLFINGEICGLLSIDSKEKNAFTTEDWKSMEYIRGNIEIALQKHFLYTKMVTLSRFDELTGIYNRAYFMEQFNHVLNNAERYQQSFILTIFDINDLKKINDNDGHLAGDIILKAFANVMVNSIRKTDIFARWGGDEFMGLFYHIKEVELQSKFQSIGSNLEETPVTIEGKKIQCRFSFGYAKYPEDGPDFDSLLKIADERMYQHKKKMKSSDS